VRYTWRAISVFVLSLWVGASWASAQSGTLPQFGHVVIVVGENHSFSETTGSNMPYLTSLYQKYGLATKYYADTHRSIGNYFTLATGQILTNNDKLDPSNFPVSADNIALEVQKAGKTWKDYVEDLPSVSGC
jgi:phosphatidylinositol-3-phosphatase